MSTKNNAEVKVTRNTTVEQLKGILNANFKAVTKKDKALADSISYASQQMKKDPKAVKKADLADLAKQVITLLGDSVKPAVTLKPAVENSTKPKLSAPKGSKKSETKTEDAPADKGEEKKTEPKKPENSKPAEDKKPAKKPPVADMITAEAFPKEFTAGDVKYELATDITDMKGLLEAFNKDEEFVFAFYWNKAQIKQSAYGSGLLAAPKEFANNLDLASVLYVSDECKVTYALSMYTEVLYQIMPDAFEEIEGVRYSMGIEYQLYRAVAEK